MLSSGKHCLRWQFRPEKKVKKGVKSKDRKFPNLKKLSVIKTSKMNLRRLTELKVKMENSSYCAIIRERLVLKRTVVGSVLKRTVVVNCSSVVGVTNNISFQNYPHPDDHTVRTTDTPGFKPFTKMENTSVIDNHAFNSRQFISNEALQLIPFCH